MGRSSKAAIAVAATGTVLLASACSGSGATGASGGTSEQIGQGKGPAVTVWWSKGLTPKEDSAVRSVMQKWAKQSGHKVDVTFITAEDLDTKITAALSAGNAPDIAFATLADAQQTPELAKEGKLVDVSSVIATQKDNFSDTALASVKYENTEAGKRSFYAVPIEQQSVHVFYRTDDLKKAGLPATPPTSWNQFWGFWKNAQKNLQAKGQKNVYGMGIPISTATDDTDFILEEFLNAYHVTFFNDQGKFMAGPQTQQRLAQVYEFLASLYKNGYEPKGAVNWKGSETTMPSPTAAWS